MKIKEALLWSIFFIASLCAGYFHGHLIKLDKIKNIKCSIKVLIIPSEIIPIFKTQQMNNISNCEVNYVEFKNGKDLELNLITHSDIDLIIASQVFGNFLNKNNLINENKSWDDLASKYLDKDFVFTDGRFFFPILWYQSKLSYLGDLKPNFQKYINNKNIQIKKSATSTKLINENAILISKEKLLLDIKNIPQYLLSNKIAVAPLSNSAVIEENEFLETPHVTQILGKTDKTDKLHSELNYEGGGFVILGLMIPKNATSIDRSSEIASVILQPSFQKKLIDSLPFATAYKILEPQISIKEKQSQFVSEIKLLNLNNYNQELKSFDDLDTKLLK